MTVNRDTRYRWCAACTTLLLSLLLAPLARAQGPAVTGTVVEAGSERALPGAEVTLRRASASDIARRTTTGTDGTFQLADVRPGSYTLSVRLLGYVAHERALTVELGEPRDLRVALSREAASLETVVRSPTGRTALVVDVPASVSVVEPETIRREGVSSSVEALRPTVGVDVAQTGVDRRLLALRGFGDPFFGTPHLRIDERPAAAPLLGTNAFEALPVPSLDLSQIEVVRGPGTPLYGPEASGGLVQFVPRSPFLDPGTSLSVAGGSRSFVDVQVRQAGAIGGTVGYKFTGQYGRASEWPLDPTDPMDAAEQGRYRTYGPDEPIPPGRPTAGRQLRRDDRYRTYNASGLLTYRFDASTALSLRGGYTSLTSPLQTGLGTLQAHPLSTAYGQLQLSSGPLDAQVGLHRTLSRGEVYRLSTGAPVVEAGTRWTGRVQYAPQLRVLGTELLAGGDFDMIRPEGSTTTLARQRGDRGIGRYGAFAQSTTRLPAGLSLTLGGRLSYNDVVEEASVLPRAALVCDVAPGHALRISYARAVSFPGTDPLFAAGRFAVDPSVRTATQSVEVGYKGTFAGRVRVDASGYYETKADVLTPVRNDMGLDYGIADRIQYGGLDAAVRVRVTDRTSAFANMSLVSDDQFEGSEGPPVALNAPSIRLTGGFDYGLPAGVSVGATAQYVEGFSVRWGPYIGTVSGYTRLDVRLGYDVPVAPSLHADLSLKNILGPEHREFVGAPELGRMFVARLTYGLN